MATVELGRVKSPKGKSYKVKWNPATKSVFVSGMKAGRASSASDAMHVAKAFVHNR